jgi:hypothetical protein
MLEAALLLRTVGVDTQLPEEEAEVSLFLGDQALDLMQALPHLRRRGIREVLGHAELEGTHPAMLTERAVARAVLNLVDYDQGRAAQAAEGD